MRLNGKDTEENLIKFRDFICRIEPNGCRTADDMKILDYEVKRNKFILNAN
jgi:hypothetical protein